MNEWIFTLAVAQMGMTPGDRDANLAAMADWTARAVGEGARLVVFPELATTGYGFGPALRDLAEPLDGPSRARLAEAAREHGVAICYGHAERDGEAVYNSAALLGSDGALLICYEVEFPELVRRVVLEGAELVIVPSATASYLHPSTSSRTVVASRATENNVFVAYANHCGSDGRFTYNGESIVAGPLTEIYALAGGGEALSTTRPDKARLAEGRATVPYLRDLRPELYGGPAAGFGHAEVVE